MGEHREVLHERLYLKEPRTERLRKGAAAHLRHLLADGWRETERWHADNYITVRVERRFPHPRYKKVVTGYKKFYAHDEKSEAKVGDRVRIQETRPLSKMKRWRLMEVVERTTGVTPVAV